jgi:hypothetical protein
MKLYPTVDVDFNYQNFGSAWLGILRGATENIELVFNGLYNLCATNGTHQFQDHLQCVSIFWTDKRAMRRFFFNRYYLPRFTSRFDVNNGKLVRQAMRHAHEQLAILSQDSHETYLRFNRSMPETYSSGTICAERPDNDMKDAILANAFKEKDTKTVDTSETI